MTEFQIRMLVGAFVYFFLAFGCAAVWVYVFLRVKKFFKVKKTEINADTSGGTSEHITALVFASAVLPLLTIWTAHEGLYRIMQFLGYK